MFNRTLNPSVAESLKDAATFGKTWANYESIEGGLKTLDGALWKDVVSQVAFGGLTDDADAMLSRLSTFEAAASEAHGVKRERAARKGVASTDYVVPPTFKSYKSTIKGAIENGVELLDANGFPRSRNDVTEDLKNAKSVASEKTEEEKLGTMTDSWLAVYGKCDRSNPLFVDAVNKIINRLAGDGLLPTVDTTALPVAA